MFFSICLSNEEIFGTTRELFTGLDWNFGQKWDALFWRQTSGNWLHKRTHKDKQMIYFMQLSLWQGTNKHNGDKSRDNGWDYKEYVKREHLCSRGDLTWGPQWQWVLAASGGSPGQTKP